MAESKDSSHSVPSKEELGQLPRKAVIAFAARCALRVQPLFKHAWPDAPEEHVKALERAITFAQASALRVGARELRGAAHAAADAGAAAYTAAAAYAAYTAGAAARTAAAYGYNDVADAAADTAVRAVRAARADISGDIRRDYELLKAASQEKGRDENTPVPPEFFGPLWPEGEPEGWLQVVKMEPVAIGVSIGEPTIEIADVNTRIGPPNLLIVWDPDVFSENEYAELVTLLGDLARKYGGIGVQRLRAGGAEVSVTEGVTA